LGFLEPIFLLLSEVLVVVVDHFDFLIRMEEFIFAVKLDSCQLVEDVAVRLVFLITVLGHILDPFSAVLGGLVARFGKLLLHLSVLSLFCIYSCVCVDVVLSEFVDEVALVLLDFGLGVEVHHSERAHHADDVRLLLHASHTLFVEIQAINSLLVPIFILAAAETVFQEASEEEGRVVVLVALSIFYSFS